MLGAIIKFKPKEEISVTDMVTAATAGSIVLATIYNWGFFFPIGGGFVAWLSVQDILVGAAITSIPTLIAAALGGVVIPNMVRRKRASSTSSRFPGILAILFDNTVDLHLRTNRRVGWWVTGMTTLVLVGFALWLSLFPAFLPAAQWQVFFGLMVFLTYGVAILSGSRSLVAIVFLGTIFITPFFMGRAEFYRAVSDTMAPSSNIHLMSDGGSVVGRIIRSTASYVVVLVGNETVILPTSRIASVTTAVDWGL